MSLGELSDVYNKREQVNSSIKHKGDMYAWVRRNLKAPIMYKQAVVYFKDETAGKSSVVYAWQRE